VEETQQQIRSIVQRMRRIEGQARGVQRMLEEGSSCESVLIQIAAMRAALSKVALVVLGCHLAEAIRADLAAGGDGRTAAARAVEVFTRFS
jgi:DNA-binding FrmR family transcriptional regulator